MRTLAGALAIACLLSPGARADDPAAGWSRRASDAWSGVGAAIGKGAGAEAPGNPAGGGGRDPSPSWPGWAAEKAREAAHGTARAAEGAYAAARRGTALARPYADAVLQGSSGILPPGGYGIPVAGIQAGLGGLAAPSPYAVDLAAAGAASFLAVGGSMMVCGAVTSPFAAVGAGAACVPVAVASGKGGVVALRRAYSWYGRVPDEEAFALGTVFGGIGGGSATGNGIPEFARAYLRPEHGGQDVRSMMARALSGMDIQAMAPASIAAHARDLGLQIPSR